jgi:hypothetical protein
MLFRPVYGPELAAIHEAIEQAGASGITSATIYTLFVPGYREGERRPTQNVDDALAFLHAAHLAQSDAGTWYAPSPGAGDFRIHVLAHLRQLQVGTLPERHPADALYLLLLEELYVKPRLRLVHDLLVQANRLEAVQAVGGLNREKLQGWRRVLCYLGMGVQVHGEFLFAPDAALVDTILRLAPDPNGSLQTLIEGHLSRYLPCCDLRGDLTPGLETCLERLVQERRLRLLAQQDSPTRPYGQARHRGYIVLAA